MQLTKNLEDYQVVADGQVTYMLLVLFAVIIGGLMEFTRCKWTCTNND